MLVKAEVSRRSNPHISVDGTSSAVDEDGQLNDSLAIIESLGSVLLQKRQEALAWRTQCGIEQDWAEDEEFYQAIDRANPEGDSHVGMAMGKPISPEGGAENRPVSTAGRSTVFIPITRAYVDGAAARVADMLLPNDDSPWQIKPTPQPDMAPSIGGAVTPVAATAAGMVGNGPMPMMPQGMPGAVPGAASLPGMGAATGMPSPAAAGGMPPGQAMPMGVSSQVYDALPDDEKRAERANKIISDWLTECQWNAETRKAIEDASLLGTGILKGPFPMLRKSIAYVRDAATGRYVLQQKVETVPVTKRVNPRNFWTDPAGGEDHQAGSYTWELDNIGTRQLRGLLDDDTYIRENILRALREGPGAKKDENPATSSASYTHVGATFPLWYFTGDVTKRDMIAAGVPDDMLPEGEDDEVAIPALIIMVNDHVIKVAPATLETGGFNYDMFRWQRRPGIPWGKGVARQVRTPQRMLNGAVRAEMDNGALSSGPIYAIRRGWVVAIDGNDAVLTPRKGFYMTEDAPATAKIQDAISFTNIQAATADLERIIDRALRFAEDATGLPMLMQGQQGESTTTATGMTILNNNGSTVLRRIARTFDDQITEPHIRRYYDWLLAHEGNEDAKGDLQIDARGSTYLVERDLQAQNLNMLFPMLAQHPDVHPGRLAEEVLRANRVSYERIMLTDAEKKKRDSQPPPEPPQVQVARINNESREKIVQAQLQQKEQSDHRTAQLKEGELQAKVELGLAAIAKDLGISEDSLKAMLAVQVMQQHAQNVQRQHDGAQRGLDRAHERTSAIEERGAEPPAEPAGRAPKGAAYTQ